MVTYIEIIDTLMNFGIFLATALMAFVAIIALIVTNKNKKYPPFPTKGLRQLLLVAFHTVDRMIVECSCTDRVLLALGYFYYMNFIQ